jgi:hypothetical protein
MLTEQDREEIKAMIENESGGCLIWILVLIALFT